MHRFTIAVLLLLITVGLSIGLARGEAGAGSALTALVVLNFALQLKR